MGRLDKLQQRRVDETLAIVATQANEVWKHIKESESVRYAIGAMQPIDPEYTENTRKQGERVKSQLEQRLKVERDFEYQGSVTTDTHIKARSDIDLLVIRKGWVWVDTVPAPNPYKGDPVADMIALRGDMGGALRAAFPQADLDESRSRAIKLSGASLTREVDVVPASWYDTDAYVRTGDKILRAVKVFDRGTQKFIANTPFLHGRRIEERDQETHSGMRKATRLMKSLMYDSDGRVTMSSYNISGIAYNIPAQDLVAARPRELVILEACYAYCDRLVGDAGLRDSIRVPDGHRGVFGGADGATVEQLVALTKELNDLRVDILDDNARSFKRLVEARVDYGVREPLVIR